MKRFSRYIYPILLIFFLAVFLVSGYFLVTYLVDSHTQKSQFNALAEMVESARQEAQQTAPATDAPADPAAPADPDAPASPGPAVSALVTVTDPETGEPVSVLPEYSQLYLLNNDLVGWIEVPGTVINYPVMQTPDEKDFYLHTSFQKAYSRHGCIYVREECDVSAPSDNLTLYGHCMLDGSMFAALSNYTDKAFWETHRSFTFDTLTEHHTYEILAVFKTSANIGEGFLYHQFIDAADESEFDDFVSTCKRLSFYDTGVTAEYGDKLVCLSTCEYTLSNGRLVVVGKRIS